jgi:hypothetical protein
VVPVDEKNQQVDAGFNRPISKSTDLDDFSRRVTFTLQLPDPL